MTLTNDGDIASSAEGLRTVSIESTAYFAVQYPDGGLNRDTSCLAVLHGWGQNSRSFLRKFSALKRHNVLVVAPQAPHQFYLDQVRRKVGFGWLTSFDRERGIEVGVAALDRVFALIESEFQRPPRPVLLGFSQGVAMAWRYAVRGTQPVSGVVACGGDLPEDVESALKDRDHLPVMLVHGVQDAIVPCSKSEAADLALRELGHAPETLFFEGGHDIPDVLLHRLPEWLEGISRHSPA